MEKPISELDRRTIQLATDALKSRYRPREKIPDGVIPVIHYPNRRYYSRKHHRYITLEELTEWWLDGAQVIVTGPDDRDQTVSTLLRVLALLQGRGDIQITPEQCKALAAL